MDHKSGLNNSGLSNNAEERFLKEMLSQIADRLKHKYSYSDDELFGLWNKEDYIQIPVTIFSGKLSPKEALTKFLKEKYELGYSEIGKIVARDERSAWANYRRAIKKMPWPFDIKDGMTVPVSIFNSEKSVLEVLVSYLKDVKKLRNKKIAELLNKNPANVRTLYNRSNKKNKTHKHAS